MIEQLMGIAREELLSHLSVLKESELVYERGIYPQSSYIFRHALIRDTVYQLLLKDTRVSYHCKIVEILESSFPELTESWPDLLAHHYTRAGMFAEGFPFWYRAAQLACHNLCQVYFALGMLSESRTYSEKGIQLLGSQALNITDWPGGNPGAQCFVYASAAASVLDEYKKSVEYSARALELNESDPKPFSRISALGILCIPMIVRRDRAAASVIVAQISEMSSRFGYRVWPMWAQMVDGWRESE